MRRLGSKKGFTLVELSLSIAFIAILSITIALIINDAISTYRRGITLNQINTVGMDLVDDIRMAVQNSPVTKLIDICQKRYSNVAERNKCLKNGAKESMLVTTYANEVKLRGKESNPMRNVPISGAFCTGSYSYIWNSGYLFSDDVANKSDLNSKLATLTYGSTTRDNFRLLKVRDKERDVCLSVLSDTSYGRASGKESNFTISSAIPDEEAILLENNDNNSLALYDLSAAVPASNDLNAMFYSMSFILGTVQGGINVMSNGNFCTAPEGFNSNFDYCAINKFNFAAQANGRK